MLVDPCARLDVERPEVLRLVIDVREADGKEKIVLPVEGVARRIRRLRSGAEAVGGDVVAAKAKGPILVVVVINTYARLGRADRRAEPHDLAERVPAAAGGAAVDQPAVAPARHLLVGPALEEFFGAEVEQGELVVIAAAAP